ncbi:hypothetical protein G3495_18630 [Shewanella baltica]|jgi:hypothetical protein|uniref:hypothetical protein n=1 Tax=Shewanella baltica TaxID=62322 RepID=UPI00217D53B8|nr:hypothetical protein [Shewanella baltica]MCS6237106.1 hypothetical protein [Shewanella baltica]MCS6272574.1 hypothetical protein [Shewanella baltica]
MNNQQRNAKLMKASEWAGREFADGSAPQNRTIKTWILRGKVRGAIIDGKVYVYEDQHFGIPQAVSNTVMSLVAASV